MSLCRHYVRELRRSVLVGTPPGDKAQSKRSSQILEGLGDMRHGAAGPSFLSADKDKDQDDQLSAFLRESPATDTGHSPHPSVGSHGSGIQHTPSNERPRPSFMSSPLDLTSDSNSPAHTVARVDIRASAEKILYTYLIP